MFGLLGGLIGGGLARGLVRPSVGNFVARTAMGSSPLGGLLQGANDARRPRPVLAQPTIGKTKQQPVQGAAVQQTEKPESESPIGSALLGPSPQQGPGGTVGPAATAQRQDSVPPPASQQQSERPIEPKPMEQIAKTQEQQTPKPVIEGERAGTPPVLQEQAPIDVEKIDISEGIQPPEMKQQTQNIPPLRYFPTPNALPAVHPRAMQTGTDKIAPAPDMGYSFKRPEGVEDYAAKFTYRRR